MTGSCLVCQSLPIFAPLHSTAALITSLLWMCKGCPPLWCSITEGYPQCGSNFLLYHLLQCPGKPWLFLPPLQLKQFSPFRMFFPFSSHKHTLIFIENFPKTDFHQGFCWSYFSSSEPGKKAGLGTGHLTLNPSPPLSSSWVVTKKPPFHIQIKME